MFLMKPDHRIANPHHNHPAARQPGAAGSFIPVNHSMKNIWISDLIYFTPAFINLITHGYEIYSSAYYATINHRFL
jgi:hypothetical protein